MFAVYGCIFGMIKEEERFMSGFQSTLRPARNWFINWRKDPRMQRGYDQYMKVQQYLSK